MVSNDGVKAQFLYILTSPKCQGERGYILLKKALVISVNKITFLSSFSIYNLSSFDFTERFSSVGNNPPDST